MNVHDDEYRLGYGSYADYHRYELEEPENEELDEEFYTRFAEWEAQNGDNLHP